MDFWKIFFYKFFDNFVYQYLFAFLAFFFVRLFFYKVEKFFTFLSKTKKFKSVYFFKFLKTFPAYFKIFVQVFVVLKILNLPQIVDQVLNGIFLLLVGIWLNSVVVGSVRHYFKKYKIKKTMLDAVLLVEKILFWTVIGLLILVNFDIKITPLLASLGIGGIAIAFALQNILQDFFSSFGIIFSKVFEVGDYVELVSKGISGDILEINLKFTRIKAVEGYEIVVPNREILEGGLKNFGKMEYRKVRFNVGIIYETGINKLKEIPKIVQKVAKNVGVDFEWCYLVNLGDFSIDFKISYIIMPGDYENFLKIHHEFLLNLLELFEKNNIEIAYPAQKVFLQK